MAHQRRTAARAASTAARHAIAGRRDHRPADHRDRDRRVPARRAAAGRTRPRRIAGGGTDDGARRAGAACRSGADRDTAWPRRRLLCARPMAGVVHRCGRSHAARAPRRVTRSLRRDLPAAGHRHAAPPQSPAPNTTCPVCTARFEAYRTAESGLAAQQADSRFHLAIMDAAHNDVLKQVLLDLKATVSIGAPAHLWGEPSTMREHGIARPARARGAGAMPSPTAVATTPTRWRAITARIDFELITTAMRRAGVLVD